MVQHPEEPTTSRGDRAALWFLVTAGAAIALFTVVHGVSRIADLVRNTGVIEALLLVAATLTGVILLALLTRELLSGRIFSRRNTHLVAATGITAVAALLLVPFFGNMVAGAAFANISDGTFNNVIMSVNLSTLVVATFVAAFISAVFAVGDRLQRDQEGLV